MQKDEKGFVVVEAAYVFPIAIYVVIFLIYLGNAYYVKAQIDDYTTQAALEGAEQCANPLSEYVENGTLKMKTEARMYRYISLLNSYMGTISDQIEEELKNKIIDSNISIFVGMEPEIIGCEAKYKGNLVEPSFSVEVEYSIKTPIRFILTDEDTIVTIHSKAEVPVVDMGEFIGIIDMAEDYLENTGALDAIKGVAEKLKGLMKK